MKPLRALAAILLLSFLSIMISTSGANAESGVTRTFVVSTNPILDMFTWYNAEVEVRIANSATVGVSGSFITFNVDEEDEETFMAVNGFFRFYPQAVAPEGFFFGGRFGTYKIEDKEEDVEGNVLGFGIDIGYSWLLGEGKNFNLSLGIGAVRLFGGDLDDLDVAVTLPTVRLVNIGVAF